MAENHSPTTEKKQTGAFYTPPVLAEFVARRLLDAGAAGLGSRITLLDPALGDGQLLLSLLGNLPPPQRALVTAVGYDTDPRALQIASERLQSAFPEVGCDLRCENFLTGTHAEGNHGLSGAQDVEPVDWVIANPPYVRAQVLGADTAQELAGKFELSGRVDLYYAFILAIAAVLKPGGAAGIIVSNRFMTTKAGAEVRRRILQQFNVLHVWDLGDTRLFDAAVLPAVLLLERKNGLPAPVDPAFTAVYSAERASAPQAVFPNIFDALHKEGVVQTENGRRYLIRQGSLAGGQKPGEIWRLTNRATREWLATVDSHTCCTFADVGKIRVGVKTTADKVFIRDDWHALPADMQPELLRPLTSHHVAGRFRARSSARPRQILYTHQVRDGKRAPVNLDDYPRAAKYLNRHRAILESRAYVRRVGRQWFEIWIPQDPEIWRRPKLVWRDISEQPVFWLDTSGSVVNGDCYWLAADAAQSSDWLWLALAVGNSTFIEAFYDRRFNNKLYAGRRRFMTQYVEKFPLPDAHGAAGQKIIRLTKALYAAAPSSAAEELETKLDVLVWDAFGVR